MRSLSRLLRILFLLGGAEGLPAVTPAQQPAQQAESLVVGSWLTRSLHGDWSNEFLIVGQDILTLHADYTWTERRRFKGGEWESSKGTWSFRNNSLVLSWEAYKETYQLQGQQLVLKNRDGCSETRYRRIEPSKPLPAWATSDAITVQRKDLVGRWVLKPVGDSLSGTLTLHDDGTWTQQSDVKGARVVDVPNPAEQKYRARGVWFLLPEDHLTFNIKRWKGIAWGQAWPGALMQIVKLTDQQLTLQPPCHTGQPELVYTRPRP